MRRRARLLWILPAVLIAGFFFIDLEPRFTPRSTGVVVSERARKLHDDAIVADLHVDSLLWPRDLDIPASGGQLDLPRMRAGGLDVAALTVPTRFFALAGLKAFHDRWPIRSWVSPFERMRVQIEKASLLRDARLAADVASIRRNHAEGVLSYFHGVEGAHALGGDVTRVGPLRDRGVVFIGLVHLNNNAYGGSSSGRGGRLTEKGRELLSEMNRRGVLLDLAHASEETFFDAISHTDFPPVVSHTGARAVHDTWRNITDEQIRAVASKGGVIGVMLAPPALSEPSLEEWLRHVEHVVAIGGEGAAALGSDFDGYVVPPIDASRLPELTQLMLSRGWSEARVRKILGENVLRVLSAVR